MPNPERNLAGSSRDNPVDIGRGGRGGRGRRDEFQRRFDAEKQNSQQPTDSVPLQRSQYVEEGSLDDSRRKLNARYEVVTDDVKSDSRKLRGATRLKTIDDQDTNRRIDRNIDAMFKCIKEGKLEDVKTTLTSLRDNAPGTYKDIKETVDRRYKDERNEQNRQIWDIIHRVFFEEDKS